MESLNLLSKIALSFQNLNNFDEEMNIILKDLGEFTDANRIYIFLNQIDDLMCNTYEWCNEGIEPQIQNLQKCKHEFFDVWHDLLKENGYVCANDISELPIEVTEILTHEKIKAIISYPIIVGNKIIGFIGVDEYRSSRKWTLEERQIISTVSGIISNAYERKFFKQDIVDSDANFHNFFETIDDMFLIVDLDGNIINCNKLLIKKLGYSLSELKGINVLNLHPEDKRESAYDKWASILKGEHKYCSLEIKSKNGNIHEVESRLWYGKWNKSDCVYIVSKDVTKQNEHLTLASKIFENNPMPMTITDVQTGKLVEINPSYTEKTGYTKEEIIGKTIDDMDIFKNLDSLRHVAEKIRRHERVENEELVIECKNGTLLTVIFSIETISHNGKQSLLTVMVDITEKMELIKSVKDKCMKLNNIIEGTHLATCEWNIQTDEIELNQKGAEIMGYTLEEIETITSEIWIDSIHPEDREQSKKLLEEHLNGKTDYYECDIRKKQKDGSWIWVQNRGKVIYRDDDGNPLKMFGTFSDITSRKKTEAALRESEKRFFLALDETSAGLWDLNIINDEVFLSPMWKKILGYDDDELENSFESWESLWHPDDVESIRKASDDYAQGKTNNYRNIHRLKHKDGSWRWILSRGGILKEDKGKPYRWIGTNIDITKEHEQSLELERIFSVNLDLLCILDAEGKFIKLNKAWDDILGYDIDKLKGQNILHFIHKEDIKDTVWVMENLKSDEKVNSFVNRYRNKDGKYCYLEWRANPYEGMIYASGRDITERIEYEQKILELSHRDSLTNAYNRRYFFSKAKEILQDSKVTGESFSLCIIDMDHFKIINDTFGHQAGDFILKEFTKVISGNLCSCDILGRYGGEEFIIISKNTDNQRCNMVVERILNEIRQKIFIYGDSKINFTFSAGIVNSKEVENCDRSIDKIVEIADERLYHAKQTGRNKIVLNIQ